MFPALLVHHQEALHKQPTAITHMQFSTCCLCSASWRWASSAENMFDPSQSSQIFRAKKSSACLPSEGKWSCLSHVADLRHVKEPCSLSWKSELAGKIPWTFLARFRSSLSEVSDVAWHGAPLEMTDETKWRCTEGLQAYGLGAHGVVAL
jgi:hypothetical protein